MQFSTDSWTTFKGKEVDTIDHQHLSNCYCPNNPNRIMIHNGNYEIGEIFCTPTNRIELN
jgi:hypothetical protein